MESVTFKRGDLVKNVGGVRGGVVITAELALVWEGTPRANWILLDPMDGI